MTLYAPWVHFVPLFGNGQQEESEKENPRIIFHSLSLAKTMRDKPGHAAFGVRPLETCGMPTDLLL